MILNIYGWFSLNDDPLLPFHLAHSYPHFYYNLSLLMKDADLLRQALQPLEMGNNDVFLCNNVTTQAANSWLIRTWRSFIRRKCHTKRSTSCTYVLHYSSSREQHHLRRIGPLRQRQMEQPHRPHLAYICLHQDSNKLTAKGCKYITRASLKALTSLSVSTSHNMQVTTSWVAREPSTSPKECGQS